MKEVLGVQTLTFDVGDGFFVDIVTDNPHKEYDAWLYHKDYGVKQLMFGGTFEQNRYKDFLNLVEVNLDGYEHDYWLDVR